MKLLVDKSRLLVLLSLAMFRIESASAQPPDAHRLYKEGTRFEELYKYQEAIDRYSKSISTAEKRSPKQEANLYYHRGRCYVGLGKYAEAQADLDKSIKLYSLRASAHRLRAVVARLQKQYDNALSCINRAIALEPQDSDLFSERATIYADCKKFKEALTDCNTAMRFDPEENDPYVIRGSVYEQLNQLDKALSDYTKAIELSPDSKTAYFKRAALYQKLGKADLAEKDIKTGKRYIKWGEL